MPFSASVLAAKGDPIANLQEDLAADVAPTIVQHQKKYSKVANIITSYKSFNLVWS